MVTCVVTLYNFANMTLLGIQLMMKTSVVSVGSYFILYVPSFIQNLRKAKKFYSQDERILETVLNFWEIYEQQSV